MDGIAEEDLLEKLSEYTRQTIHELLIFLIANRKYDYPVFTRDVIDSLYALSEALSIIEPNESAKNIENIIWNLCLALDDDVRLNRTSRHGSLNYGWLYLMANDAIRVVFASGCLVEGSDTAQLWKSIEEYPVELSRRNLSRDVYLWDLCSYLHMLLIYRSCRGQRYDDNIRQVLHRLAGELKDCTNLPANVVGYMLILLKKAEDEAILKLDLNYEEIYSKLQWKEDYRNRCYKVYDGLMLGVDQSTLLNDVKGLLAYKKEGLLKKRDLAAFLLFSSRLLMSTGRKVEVPFFTYEHVESIFFGVVISTYMNVVASLETERKTSKLDENTFRNRFLQGLRTKFGDLASSETFRCEGFTDIRVVNPRNRDETLVTEIKIWRGPKRYQNGITQALGYLRSNEDILIMIAIREKKETFFDFFKSFRKSIETHQNYVEKSFFKGVFRKSTWRIFEDAYFFSEHKSSSTGRKVRVYHIVAEI